MSDMILWRAARVVPRCSEVTGTASELVVVGETFAPLCRCANMGQVLGCHFVGGKCMCSISLISVPPGGSALICTPPTPPRSTSQTR